MKKGVLGTSNSMPEFEEKPQPTESQKKVLNYLAEQRNARAEQSHAESSMGHGQDGSEKKKSVADK